jgi:predicted ATPase
MAPARRGAGNLPAELTSFVGRRGEIAEVRRVLAESRLVTLTGVGGVGKTRLALRAAAGLRVLATSRESLNIAAETALPVLPLAAPDPGQPLTLAQLGAFPAVALFAERAAQVMPGFAVTEANMAAVPGICRRLEGLPLALELAAARTRVLSPEQIDARLGLLTWGSRTKPAATADAAGLDRLEL